MNKIKHILHVKWACQIYKVMVIYALIFQIFLIIHRPDFIMRYEEIVPVLLSVLCPLFVLLSYKIKTCVYSCFPSSILKILICYSLLYRSIDLIYCFLSQTKNDQLYFYFTYFFPTIIILCTFIYSIKKL